MSGSVINDDANLIFICYLLCALCLFGGLNTEINLALLISILGHIPYALDVSPVLFFVKFFGLRKVPTNVVSCICSHLVCDRAVSANNKLEGIFSARFVISLVTTQPAVDRQEQ